MEEQMNELLESLFRGNQENFRQEVKKLSKEDLIELIYYVDDIERAARGFSEDVEREQKRKKEVVRRQISIAFDL